MIKDPGPGGMRLRQIPLDMSFAEAFDGRTPDAYERLIMDVIRGNQTLFMRRDEVEAAWSWIDPILNAWAESRQEAQGYTAGTWGPSAVDRAHRTRRPHLARERVTGMPQSRRTGTASPRAAELAEALADDVAGTLAARDRAQAGTGFLAVSGGTTPAHSLRALSTKPIAWDKVIVTLVDERFVPPTSPRSNAGAGAPTSCCRARRRPRASCRSIATRRQRRGSGRSRHRASSARAAVAARRRDPRHGRRTATPPRSSRTRPNSRRCFDPTTPRLVLPVDAPRAPASRA